VLSLSAQVASVKNNPEYDEKPVHFGYTLGLNVMDFNFSRKGNPDDTLYADVGQLMPGFQVGMIMDYRLGEYFNLRCLPSFNFGQRNLVYTIVKGDIHTFNYVQKIESSMIDFPVLLKYKAKRINNYRPYLIAGGSARFDLASKKKFDENLTDYVLLNKFDIYYEFGFGIDYYLPYFKLSTEIKLSEGLLDVLNHTTYSLEKAPYVNSLVKLNSQIIMFSLHFE
jgi:hypothetical protein